MKRLPKLVATLILSASLLYINENTQAQGVYDYDQYDGNQGNYETSYQDFYDGLAPYGQWIYDQQFGYVWMPNVGPDFRPYYTNGYWAMTQYGNTWVSNYDWGWAAFHYGRWTFDDYYGWLWIPDTQWAPAWVSWRSNYNYYGWAPMGPGVGINISLGQIPVDWWVFLSPNYFYEPQFHRYCNNDWRFRRSIYTQTNYVNYTYRGRRGSYYTGPRADDYRRRTGRETSMFRINDNKRRGATNIRGNQISIYRPAMRSRSNDAPTRIVQTNRNISSKPQSFTQTNEAPTGRQRILNQTPVENKNTNRQTGQNIRTDKPQTEQNDNRIKQESQRQLEQRDVQMIRQEQKMKSTQTEESNRLRMQQMREEQIQKQRNQEQNKQRMVEQGNQQRIQQEQEANRQRMQIQRDREQGIQRMDEQHKQQRIQEMNRQGTQQITPRQNEQITREARPTTEQRANTEQRSSGSDAPSDIRRHRD